MTKRELCELLEKMINVLGEERLLDELFVAIPSNLLEEYLTYIADQWDISYLYKS